MVGPTWERNCIKNGTSDRAGIDLTELPLLYGSKGRVVVDVAVILCGVELVEFVLTMLFYCCWGEI